MSQTESTEPPGRRLGVVILAAGQGTRMRSSLPKVLHPIAGRPMIEHVTRAAIRLAPARTVVVIPPNSADLRASLEGFALVVQDRPLGTGDAVRRAREALDGICDLVVVLYADTPLLRVETIEKLIEALSDAPIALLSAELADPDGYGRVVRDSSGRPIAIAEQAEASADERTIDEVNSGLMAFQAEWLWGHLDQLQPRSKGELYLTDLAGLAVAEGRLLAAIRAGDPAEALGINTQAQLAEAARLLMDRRRNALMQAGVTLVDPQTTYLDLDVEVGPETLIEPNSHLRGATKIGRRCHIGPNAYIADSTVDDDCRIWFSVVESSSLARHVSIGPFAHTRPGTRLDTGVYLGSYAEVKDSTVGAGTQMHHFGYVGDADIGANVNIGAGVVTCNVEGQTKHRTIIGDDAFIGSSTMLMAPVEVGARGRTGAGSVVRRSVEPDQTVVGVPARPLPPRDKPGSPSLEVDGE